MHIFERTVDKDKFIVLLKSFSDIINDTIFAIFRSSGKRVFDAGLGKHFFSNIDLSRLVLSTIKHLLFNA